MNSETQTLTYPERLRHIKTALTDLSKAGPEVATAFGHLHKSAVESRALDTKAKELIALAIAVAARCDGCIAFHTHDALRAGATRDEIVDTLGVAIMMGGGPSLVYATHVFEAVDEFERIAAPELESVDPKQTKRGAYLDGCHHFD